MSKRKGGRPRIDHRWVLQLLLGGATTGIAGVPGLSPSHPTDRHFADAGTVAAAEAQVAAAEWSPAFLSDHQSETLAALAERIVPASRHAQVNRFFDLLPSVDTPENQKKFLNSLSAFEAAAVRASVHCPHGDSAE